MQEKDTRLSLRIAVQLRARTTLELYQIIISIELTISLLEIGDFGDGSLKGTTLFVVPPYQLLFPFHQVEPPMSPRPALCLFSQDTVGLEYRYYKHKHCLHITQHSKCTIPLPKSNSTPLLYHSIRRKMSLTDRFK